MLYDRTHLWAIFFVCSFVAAAPALTVSSDRSTAISQPTATETIHSPIAMRDSDDTDDLFPTTNSSSSEAGQSCTTHYKIFLDTFSIYGVNWDTSELGEDGAGLKKEIKKCGALTKWKFKDENVEAPWSFHATGQMIIGEQACIGRAVKAAGGPRDSCGGTT
ncbi:SGNH hydrolase-type esterase domain protein [Rutstroemia sp. NJR-2017a BVV2]|nr:SGNH hydrolase-type esterase domain protein [Rutstroemia sp. NJR-2017a BVV2]